MAIFHLSAQIIGRTAGRSSVAAAAYRHGERLVDERTGLVHDYTAKAGVSEVIVLAPGNAPAWVHTGELWQRVEASETRKNSQTAREINFALPVELDAAQRRALMLGYCQAQFVDLGMVADLSFHDDNPENPHAHVMLTTREIGPEGFGKKVREWNSAETLGQWRGQWQAHANDALQRAGQGVRINHRTLAVQQAEALACGEEMEAMKLNRGPQRHEGTKLSDRVQVENQTVRQELVEAQAKAALWEWSNSEVVAAMKARAEQERFCAEEAEKDRAWSAKAASAVADTKRVWDYAKSETVRLGETAKVKQDAEITALANASDARVARSMAKANARAAAAAKRQWIERRPFRVKLNTWGWKSSELEKLGAAARETQAEFKRADETKRWAFDAHELTRREAAKAHQVAAATQKQEATERARHKAAVERLAAIEAETLIRPRAEQEQAERVGAIETMHRALEWPRGSAWKMQDRHKTDGQGVKPQTRRVPRLRPRF